MEYFYNLANALSMQHLFSEAIPYYKQAIEVSSNVTEAA
jgi:tetratricopeptide (TPR) repeat protein